MTFENSLPLIIRAVVNVDLVIMGANGKLIIFGVVLHALNPLFSVINCFDYIVKVGYPLKLDLPYSDLAKVIGNS